SGGGAAGTVWSGCHGRGWRRWPSGWAEGGVRDLDAERWRAAEAAGQGDPAGGGVLGVGDDLAGGVALGGGAGGGDRRGRGDADRAGGGVGAAVRAVVDLPAADRRLAAALSG